MSALEELYRAVLANPDALIESLGRAVVLAALEWIDTQGAA